MDEDILRDHADEIDDFEDVDEDELDDLDNEDEDVEESDLQFANAFEFVETFLAPIYAVGVNQRKEVKWCKQWWAHPEAVYRLDSLWRRYEQLHAEEPLTCGETFLRVCGDYHMDRLMSAGQPFDACYKEHQAAIELETEPMPSDDGEEDLW